MKIRYIGEKNCTIKLIDGGEIGNITPGKVINLRPKDHASLIDLASRTKKPEWQPVE